VGKCWSRIAASVAVSRCSHDLKVCLSFFKNFYSANNSQNNFIDIHEQQEYTNFNILITEMGRVGIGNPAANQGRWKPDEMNHTERPPGVDFLKAACANRKIRISPLQEIKRTICTGIVKKNGTVGSSLLTMKWAFYILCGREQCTLFLFLRLFPACS